MNRIESISNSFMNSFSQGDGRLVVYGLLGLVVFFIIGGLISHLAKQSRLKKLRKRKRLRQQKHARF
ncbi:hypothetical protein ACQZV8_00480 [Magnetococcales bacterium HHB-1]